MPRFLIIRFSSIGDIVLTTPVIRCLKQQVAGAEVHFLTKEIFAPVVEHNPYADRKIYLRSSFPDLIARLKTEKYDCIIDLHHNLRSFRVKSALNIPAFSFPKKNFLKWKMVYLKKRTSVSHVTERYFETVKKLGVMNDGLGTDYFLPVELSATHPVDAGWLPESLRQGFAVIVAGAKHSTKQPPVEMMAAICSRSVKPMVLIGGKEDEPRAQQIEKLTMNPHARLINLCGKTSLHQSAWLISHADRVLTPDTGMMHIAAAFQKPIISLWGNTVPGFGMTPYYGNRNSLAEIFEVKNLPCRPCSKIGFGQCPKKHFHCMNKIDIEPVIQSLNRTA